VGGHPNQYHQSCIELAKRGYAAATIGYRLLDDAVWPDMPQDVLRGMAYLTSNQDRLGIDASKAVTIGSSAGGHLALVMQAKAAQWVAEGVVPAVPEIVGTVAQCPATSLPDPDGNKKMAKLLNGHQLSECSPAHMDPKLFKSVLIIHGDADEVIPLKTSQEFVKKLSAAGVDAKLEVLPGAAHAFAYRLNSPHAQKALEMTMPYLEKLL